MVRASLPDGRSATKPLSIEVKTALALVQPEEIPASEVGVPVSIELGATGGTPPYTWTLSAGALPTGSAPRGGMKASQEERFAIPPASEPCPQGGISPCAPLPP